MIRLGIGTIADCLRSMELIFDYRNAWSVIMEDDDHMVDH